MITIRMYKRDEAGVLHFREALYEEDEGQLMLTSGPVGHEGKAKVQDVAPEAAEGLLHAFAVASEEDGYAELDPEQQHWVIAQYALKSATGTERDRYLEHKATQAISSYFLWRGLGEVDHSEFAPRKLNIYCLVPDVNKAVAGLKVVLRDPLLDFTKLTIGSAPVADPDQLRRRYPLPSKEPFTLS
ncbi:MULTISPECIES: hypothetical protein [unclassified Arthrobacter]|uniref:hypothetical protein n=1 Tax=unclassified Arthrobacter TaxID=235627 RepID=UPI001D14320E|nr:MULTISPECIES: hypothetical protein [unclassified Arthrobacter]MCC3274810.1 hypothetical protein [Arthrobacter sp. zg-Y20]MCC9177596.1 hypothetical protein [Arthrobacter sp. zg-Y750]MDK1314966.1 hypothetical protein [Arthrobacter sp. zg.Y20]WIB04820.1 hypothetical protein QNO06_09595 [Arthrobacter sp. zg-Y20]